MNAARRRLLAVSWDMPPQSGPRAVQVSRTLTHLAAFGWDSSVVAFAPRSSRYFPDADLARRLTGGASPQVERVRSPEEWLLFRALWRVCPIAKGWPDEKSVWIGPAVRAARRLADRQPFDAIATFAQPWSDHLIGRRLRRDFGVPWIAHFSDPWTATPYVRFGALQRRIWAPMERAVVEEADALVFVNSQTADETMKRYPAAWAAKAHVVPHGHDVGMLPPRPPRSERSGPLRLVYTGRFYGRWRTPDCLLAAVAEANALQAGSLEIVFAGPIDPAAVALARRLGIESIVTFRGRQPWAEAMQLAMTADVLLVLDAPADVNLFLPSKLIEYLPLSIPILGLTPARGASADVLYALGYPIVSPTDRAGIARELVRLIDAKESGALRASPQHAEVSARYDIRRTTAAFADVLASCVGPQ